jgi:hypothetical protein
VQQHPPKPAAVQAQIEEDTSSDNRQGLAIAACVAIILVHFVGGSLLFNWQHGGGALPLAVLCFVLGATWKAITGKQFPWHGPEPENAGPAAPAWNRTVWIWVAVAGLAFIVLPMFLLYSELWNYARDADGKPTGKMTWDPSAATFVPPATTPARSSGITRIAVSSSAMVSVGYDASRQLLDIEFPNGDVYRYFDVPAAVHRGLMTASSHGTYFHASIKGRYRYERVK